MIIGIIFIIFIITILATILEIIIINTCWLQFCGGTSRREQSRRSGARRDILWNRFLMIFIIIVVIVIIIIIIVIIIVITIIIIVIIVRPQLQTLPRFSTHWPAPGIVIIIVVIIIIFMQNFISRGK